MRYAGPMIFFDQSMYSRRAYARYRSSLALERYITSQNGVERANSVKWPRAWLLVVAERAVARRS